MTIDGRFLTERDVKRSAKPQDYVGFRVGYPGFEPARPREKPIGKVPVNVGIGWSTPQGLSNFINGTPQSHFSTYTYEEPEFAGLSVRASVDKRWDKSAIYFRKDHPVTLIECIQLRPQIPGFCHMFFKPTPASEIDVAFPRALMPHWLELREGASRLFEILPNNSGAMSGPAA